MSQSARQHKRMGAALLRMAMLLVMLPGVFTSEARATAPLVAATPAVLSVTSRADSGRSVIFQAQDGEAADQSRPVTESLPHLVLYRNGSLTEPPERTLTVELTGIEVPPGGVTVALTVETQHLALDPSGASGHRLVVWRASQTISNPRRVTAAVGTALFHHPFAATTSTGEGMITTPTDYFRYEIAVYPGQRPGAAPQQVLAMDHAFLMENQWTAPLPEVQEATPGAAPDELVVHYCDMFPFRQDIQDPTTWLVREEVPEYVRSELIPAMVEAYRVQAEEWALPWHQAWTSYRPADGRRLSVALSDGETWFHGPAPTRGHAGISINLNGGAAEYDSLTDGVISNFHHELFHNRQRSLLQHHDGNGDVSGQNNAWEFFSEGTAVLASSVGQTDIQFSRARWLRAYLTTARSFLGREGFLGGDLNRSYERMAGYHASTYWRFLYEHCGGMVGKDEDPAVGMAVIWRALEVLYRGEVVDVRSSTDLVENLPAIMDRTLAGASCPFETYEQSLLAFSRAVYALRLEGGRCAVPGTIGQCGFYDPEGLYHDPPVATLAYTGEPATYAAADQPYPAGIPSSFGVDLVEVALDPVADGQGLVIELAGNPGAKAQFAVQVWQVGASTEGSSLRPAAEVLSPGPDQQVVRLMTEIDLTQYTHLGLAITRLDAREELDREGSYTISLYRADGDGSRPTPAQQ